MGAMGIAAVLDTSFWINAYRAELYQYLPRHFDVHYCSEVRDEIERPDPRHPLVIYPDTQAFRLMCHGGFLHPKDPARHVKLFGRGESLAIALAEQESWVLLIDDMAPFKYASNSLGLKAITSPTFMLHLFASGEFTYKGAIERLSRLENAISRELLDPVRRTIDLIERRKGKNR